MLYNIGLYYADYFTLKYGNHHQMETTQGWVIFRCYIFKCKLTRF